MGRNGAAARKTTAAGTNSKPLAGTVAAKNNKNLVPGLRPRKDSEINKIRETKGTQPDKDEKDAMVKKVDIAVEKENGVDKPIKGNVKVEKTLDNASKAATKDIKSSNAANEDLDWLTTPDIVENEQYSIERQREELEMAQMTNESLSEENSRLYNENKRLKEELDEAKKQLKRFKKAPRKISDPQAKIEELEEALELAQSEVEHYKQLADRAIKIEEELGKLGYEIDW